MKLVLLKCTECHHEWEGYRGQLCGWCCQPGKIIGKAMIAGFMKKIRNK